jgi:hypothetical protein
VISAGAINDDLVHHGADPMVLHVQQEQAVIGMCSGGMPAQQDPEVHCSDDPAPDAGQAADFRPGPGQPGKGPRRHDLPDPVQRQAEPFAGAPEHDPLHDSGCGGGIVGDGGFQHHSRWYWDVPLRGPAGVMKQNGLGE